MSPVGLMAAAVGHGGPGPIDEGLAGEGEATAAAIQHPGLTQAQLQATGSPNRAFSPLGQELSAHAPEEA